jgi:acetolactate synthase-1/2/3 large subunit
LFLAGLEAVRSHAGPALQHLAETIGASVITTYKAKGIIPEDHPLSLGSAGLSPLADQILLALAKSSDLVMMIGYDPIEMRLGWLDFVADGRNLVDISKAPPDHGMHHPGTRIVAEPKALLQALNGLVVDRKSWADGEPAKAKGELDLIFATRAGWGPHAIIDRLNRIAGVDGLVTVDSGAHRILLSQNGWQQSRCPCVGWHLIRVCLTFCGDRPI